MAIEYKSQPGHVSSFIKQYGLSCVGWDLDGTLANTEHLHRSICRAALQEMSGSPVLERDFRAPHYRGAFGLPGAETSIRLAMGLSDLNAEGFDRALQYARARGFPGDSLVAVGHAMTQLRDEIFSFYIGNVQTVHTPERGGAVSLKLASLSDITDPMLIARRDALKSVKVHTYPYVLEALRVFGACGLAQGVCTSSGKAFVLPLLTAFGIVSKFSAVVTADCVPDGKHKPAPDPWHLLRARLTTVPNAPRGGAPIPDMMFIENSSGGGLSSMRAGSGPTFVIADNIPATVAKMQVKMEALAASSPESVILGTATFIQDLGALVMPSRDRADG